MATIVTRAGKASPLSNTEVDANFTNLNAAINELDATSYQTKTQTGTASFTQSASGDIVRTYATATVSLPKAYPNANYQVVIEPVSATPTLGFEGQISVQSRSVNSFVLQMSGSATACSVRWTTAQ